MYLFAYLKSIEKGAGSGIGSGSGAGSGSISQKYGCGDPDADPHQNVTNRQHWFKEIFLTCFQDDKNGPCLCSPLFRTREVGRFCRRYSYSALLICSSGFWPHFAHPYFQECCGPLQFLVINKWYVEKFRNSQFGGEISFSYTGSSAMQVQVSLWI